MGEDALDPVIHTQARLRIMTTLTALADGSRLTFTKLQSLLDTTAGNLSTHLRRLEEAGYVRVIKGHQGRIPSTQVEVTRAGRRAFEDYVTQLRALLAPPADAADAGTTGPAGATPNAGTTGTTHVDSTVGAAEPGSARTGPKQEDL